MATDTLPAVPSRWELAAESIAVKRRPEAKNPRKSAGFCVWDYTSWTRADL